MTANGILIIKLGALGDVLLATPHMRRIVEAHPDARATLLTAPPYAPLLQGQDGLEVVAFPRRGFVAMWRLLGWLRRQRFAVVYDLQGSLRSRIMTRLSGARRRIGRRPDPAYTHAPPQAANGTHAFQELNALLESAGIGRAQPCAWLPQLAQDAGRVDAWLQGHAARDARLVLLHAGASAHWPSKRWPAAAFARLAQALEARGFTVIWVGGPAERAVNRRLAGQAGIDATDAFGFTELLALGRRARFAVVNDSGPMHLLAAAALPVYAFFGPTDWRCSHALGQEGRILRHAVNCSPCFLRECPPAREQRCLREITPDSVLARLAADGWL